MQPLVKFLRGFGSFGTALANAVAFLTANWVVVVSAIGAIIAGAWSTALAFFQTPGVQISIGVFVLVDRGKPRMVRSYQDYRYGLTFEGLIPSFNQNDEEAALSFGIH